MLENGPIVGSKGGDASKMMRARSPFEKIGAARVRQAMRRRAPAGLIDACDHVDCRRFEAFGDVLRERFHAPRKKPAEAGNLSMKRTNS
ncbi:hypothetical protein [Burkholderia vietnamiensis]|uniref:hypothetical protein n=1 Tax=Burkholderia vietnamiensis TaxID=60552 RepID=UPI0012DB6B83|nr:hypothetical protein [Burkholderia vietnamiensis]